MCTLLLVACGKDEPQHTPAPNNREQVTPNNNNTNSNTAGGNSSTSGNTDNNQPNTQAQLSQAELSQWLGGVDNYWGVDKFRETLTAAIGSTKSVGAKQIKLNSAKVVEANAEQGLCKVSLQVEVNGQAIEQTYAYTDLAKKPDNYFFGNSLYADWKPNQPNLLKEFALDKLIEDKNKAFFTGEYLSRFVQFKTSQHTTGVYGYMLSDEEAKAVKVTDIYHSQGAIRFRTEYNGVRSGRELTLVFDEIAYYTNKVTVDNSTAGRFYATGIAEHADFYLTQFVDYDMTRYYHEEVVAHSANAESEVVFQFKLYSQKDERTPLATITKTVSGFRSLQNLSKDLVVYGNYELGQTLHRIVGNTQGGDLLPAKLNQSIDNWIKKASFKIGDHQLGFRDITVDNGRSTISVLQGGGRLEGLHLYFVSPRFFVTSASREGNFINVKFKIQHVNGSSLPYLHLEREVRFHLIAPDKDGN